MKIKLLEGKKNKRKAGIWEIDVPCSNNSFGWAHKQLPLQWIPKFQDKLVDSFPTMSTSMQFQLLWHSWPVKGHPYDKNT